MIIVKCVANSYKHHQNDFELDRKTKKFIVFLLKRQKFGSNQSNNTTFSPRNYHYFNTHCKQYEITFNMNIVKCVANCYKHHQNDFELGRNNQKKILFFAKTAKTGVQSKHFCDVFPHNTAITLIIIANSMKLPFTWIMSSVWQTATNTIRTTLNLAEKPKKVFVIFAETSKTGVQAK